MTPCSPAGHMAALAATTGRLVGDLITTRRIPPTVSVGLDESAAEDQVMMGGQACQKAIGRLPSPPCSMHHQDRAAREAHHLLGDAAEEEASEPTMPPAAHHDQIRLTALGTGEDFLSRVADGDIH